MNRPVLIILGIITLVLVALGFLVHSFDPFTASRGIRALFFAAVTIAIISTSTLILYAIAVVWHNGLQYFLARYFGPETGYFKSAFRRAVLIGILAMILIALRRFGFFTRYFAGGAAAIILILELLYSTHDKHAQSAKL